MGSETDTAMRELEGPLDVHEARDAILEAAAELEPGVRALTSSEAAYELSIEYVNEDVYWSYWLDGVGSKVRMRINLRTARFTEVQARQFALHEILGHGLQCASYAEKAAREPVKWVRVTSVHAPQQALLEGLATALPLFVAPDDSRLVARTLMSHYSHLVMARIHLAINGGRSVEDCLELGRSALPYWDDERLGNALSDRSVNPLLRTYLWSYPAGTDWFVRLAAADADIVARVFHAAYVEPLSPSQLEMLWPEGPSIGGQN